MIWEVKISKFASKFINVQPEADGKYDIMKALELLNLACAAIAPEQYLNHESNFTILIKDGSIIQAILAKNS